MCMWPFNFICVATLVLFLNAKIAIADNVTDIPQKTIRTTTLPNVNFVTATTSKVVIFFFFL